jgi:hypothetical protein
MENILGKKFGYLTVLEEIGFVYRGKPTAKRRYKRRLYRCLCVCGQTIDLVRSDIISGNTKSCGCMTASMNACAKFNDLTARRFGRLLVQKHLRKEGQHHVWECLCDCGSTTEVRANNLISETTTSCGCLFKEKVTKHGLSGNRQAYRSYRWEKNPSLKLKHYVSKSVYSSIRKQGGIKDGKTFDYLPYSAEDLRKHLESLWEPWMNWDNYGGNMDDPRKTWHIDHINPQSNFVFTSLADQAFVECWSLSNLRPLEKIENVKKGNRQS